MIILIAVVSTILTILALVGWGLIPVVEQLTGIELELWPTFLTVLLIMMIGGGWSSTHKN